jgi:hypothetical protein
MYTSSVTKKPLFNQATEIVMNEKAELSETIVLTDFGDASLETRARLPWPPTYPDAAFGFGAYPFLSE